mgnify:CR=1 FL=1
MPPQGLGVSKDSIIKIKIKNPILFINIYRNKRTSVLIK